MKTCDNSPIRVTEQDVIDLMYACNISREEAEERLAQYILNNVRG